MSWVVSLSWVDRVSGWLKLDDMEKRRVTIVKRVVFMVWVFNANELLH